MKALLSKAVGGPDDLVLQDLADPAPGPGEAVIAVKACGLNFPDLLIIEDKYQIRPPRPFAPGGEVAGLVTAVGEGVTRVAPGERVLAQLGHGGLAEAVAAPAAQMFRIPDAMDFDTAAALLMTYGTSHHALKQRADLQAGETLLILGASGGVGLAAVELGKAMGARVVAACSTQAKVEAAKAHGADSGMVYPRGALDRETQKALSEAFKAAVGPGGADVIYDAVGGDYAEPALRSIAWEGRYLVVGFASGPIPRIPLNLALLKSCQIVGVFWGAWLRREPEAYAAGVAELFDLHARGLIRPHVSERFPLERAADALRRLASREVVGKVVVTMGD